MAQNAPEVTTIHGAVLEKKKINKTIRLVYGGPNCA